MTRTPRSGCRSRRTAGTPAPPTGQRLVEPRLHRSEPWRWNEATAQPWKVGLVDHDFAEEFRLPHQSPEFALEAHPANSIHVLDAELRSLFDLHFFGPAALVRAVLPHMRARGSGAIVQMSSMGGQMFFAGFSAYSATKFALEGLMEALADEVRPFGIKVLNVEPGAFRTSLMGNISASHEIADYAETVGPTRRMTQTAGGTEPGDPAKAAAVILAALDAEQTPLRLPLGSDAIDAVLAHLDAVRSDVTTWEKTARDTTYQR